MENIAEVEVMQWCVYIYAFVSLQKNELLQTGVGKCTSDCICNLHSLSIILVFHFTEKKHLHDSGDDSGIFTESESTAFSGVSYCLLLYVAW